MICKIQRSQHPHRGRVLIYSRDRKIHFEGPIEEKMIEMFEKHGEKFFARCHKVDSEIVIGPLLTYDPGW